MAPQRISAAGLFDPARVRQLFDKARTYAGGRAGIRDNMAFTLILSTMLLDEIFVRRTRTFRSDLAIPSNIRLV